MKIGDRVRDVSYNNMLGTVTHAEINEHTGKVDRVRVTYDDNRDEYDNTTYWYVEDYEVIETPGTISENSMAVVTSGEKRTFPSGAQRDDVTGKERLDFIDPEWELRVAKHLTAGAEHYGDYNWVKGIPSSEYMASLLRHIRKYRAGWRDEDHLAAADFNLMGLARNEGTDLDDLFDWKKKS